MPSAPDAKIERMFVQPEFSEERGDAPSWRTTAMTRPVTPEQFERRYDDLTLLRILRKTSRAARKDNPLACTQAQFNAARDLHAWPDCPKGARIAATLRLPWPKLLQIANSDREQWSRSLGRDVSDRGRKEISLQQALQAMASVASGAGGELTGALYTAKVDEVNARARRRHKHGRERVGGLPELSQVVFALKRYGYTWTRALKEIGVVAAPKYGVRSDKSDLNYLMWCFAGATEYYPFSIQQFRRWVNNAGAGLTIPSKQKLDDAIQFEAERRAQAGEPELPTAPVDLVIEPPPAAFVPVRQSPSGNQTWPVERVIVGLAAAVPHLEQDERLNQKAIKRISPIHKGEGIPSWGRVYNAIKAHNARGGTQTSFHEVRDQALDLARQRKAGSAGPAGDRVEVGS